MIDAKLVFTITHLFGVIIAVGGVFMTDTLFISALLRKRISAIEVRSISLMSRMIWVGFLLIFLSGYGLFVLDFAKYLASSKFLAKMSIVFLVLLNGLVMHFMHLPILRRVADEALSASALFRERSPLLFASGAVSVTSWTTAVVLGAMNRVSYSYGEIMGAYLVVLLVALCASQFVRKQYLARCD